MCTIHCQRLSSCLHYLSTTACLSTDPIPHQLTPSTIKQNSNRHILLQNENGPCPLLAAANALLLRGDCQLPPDCISSNVASLDDLSNMLAEQALLKTNSFHLHELLTIFPTLQDGMDVNPKFTCGVSGMEYTAQLTAFEMLNIQMVHGWLLDPQDQKLKIIIGSRTYNELIELVVMGKEAEGQLDAILQKKKQAAPALVEETAVEVSKDGTPPSFETTGVIAATNGEALPTTAAPSASSSKPNLEEQATTGALIDSFLQSTSHQLTTYGLYELYNHVEPDTLCVFFRNNHFCTMTKHDGVLYMLVTDLGYANVPEIMWEKLDAINGDTEYMTPSFTKATLKSDLLPPTSGPSPERMLANRNQNDYDYQVALHLSKGGGTTDGVDNVSQEQHSIAAATEASLLEQYSNGSGNNGNGAGTIINIPKSQEETDRLTAQQLQAELNGPPESASIALARQLQQEEYQRVGSNGGRARTAAANTRTQAEKSSCVMS